MVKLKYADFTLRSRQVTLAEPVCDTLSLHRAAQAMLDRFGLDDGLFRVRLTGIAAAGLVEGPPPKLLFSDGRDRGTKLEQVTAAIAGKFEGALLQRATQLEKPKSVQGNEAGSKHKRFTSRDPER